MTVPGTIQSPPHTSNTGDVIFIANGGSSSFAAQTDRDAFTKLVAERLPGASVFFTRAEEDVAVHLGAAMDRGVSMVVACGGDGTISAIATTIADTNVVLGVIPRGTFNHFAKDLGIPLEADKALDTLRTGRIEVVDVGDVNGRCFVNNSGLGMYPDAVAMRDARRQQGARKLPAAFWAGLRSLVRYRLLAIRIVVDGTTLLRRTPIVFVGNNEYVMKTPFDPTRASLSDGKLCLYIPHPHGRLKLVWFTLRAMFGGLKSAPEFDILRTSSFTIESRHSRLRVALDGELATIAPPLEFRVRPGALRVIVP